MGADIDGTFRCVKTKTLQPSAHNLLSLDIECINSEHHAIHITTLVIIHYSNIKRIKKCASCKIVILYPHRVASTPELATNFIDYKQMAGMTTVRKSCYYTVFSWRYALRWIYFYLNIFIFEICTQQ